MSDTLKIVGIVVALCLSATALLTGNGSVVEVPSTGAYVASETTSITNPWTFSSTLGVTGATTLTGNVTFSGDLSSGTATTSTTTIAVGKVCYSFTDTDGTDLYGWYSLDGTFSTSTASCS